MGITISEKGIVGGWERIVRSDYINIWQLKER